MIHTSNGPKSDGMHYGFLKAGLIATLCYGFAVMLATTLAISLAANIGVGLVMGFKAGIISIFAIAASVILATLLLCIIDMLFPGKSK